MKIAFIIPHDSFNFDPFRNIPLNVLYLSTILKKQFKNEIELSVIDLRGVKQPTCIYYIPENDLFLYSVTTINYPETIRILNEIKEAYPKSKHVAGGIHISLYPTECLKYFDTICLGEGDNIIIDIIGDFINKTPNKIYKNVSLININKFPYADRGFIPKTAIVGKNTLNGIDKDLLGTAVLFSRGCPFKCDFCANLVKSTPRYRLPQLIVEEIEYLKKEYNIQCLTIKDDNILSPTFKKSESILTAIGKTNIKWRGNCRANGISKEIVKLSKETGCVDLSIGIESVSQPSLNSIHKNIDLIKAKEFLGYLKEFNIGIRLNLILGLPAEPKNIVNESIKFIEDVKPSSVLLSILTPVPGSEMYKNPQKFGMKLDCSIGFNKLMNIFNRFDANEEIRMSFEYDKITPFGESMSNEEIINNYKNLQSFLREQNYVF